jgi:hypothetical protein
MQQVLFLQHAFGLMKGFLRWVLRQFEAEEKVLLIGIG